MKLLSLILASLIMLMPLAAAAENNIVVGSINKSKGEDERFGHFAEGSERGKQNVDSDVILEIVGYQPEMIDSTLIEHQNVYVTALLAGIPVNPTVSVPKIRDIKIKKTDVNTTPAGKPVNVVGVQYFKPKDQELSFDNLGYIVVTLGKIPKEIDVPEKVKIGLQAEIHVDLYDRIGASTFEDVLRAEPFETWKETRYKHRNFAGYVHAKEIQDTYAVFDVYTDDLIPIAQNVKVAKGQTSGVLKEDSSLFKTPSEMIFDKYRLQVNDIRKQGDNVQFMIDRQGIIETRTLQVGQQLYPGSSWKLAKIERGAASQAQSGECSLETSLSTKANEIKWPKQGSLSKGSKIYVHVNGNAACKGKNVVISIREQLPGDTKEVYQLFERKLEKEKQSFEITVGDAPGQFRIKGERFELSTIKAGISFSADEQQEQKQSLQSKTIKKPIVITLQDLQGRTAQFTLEEGVPQCRQGVVATQKTSDGSKRVTVGTFPGAVNNNIPDEVKQSYENAVTNYKQVINDFKSFIFPQEDYVTKAQKGLVNVLQQRTNAGIPGGIIEEQEEIDNLLARTNDPLQQQILKLKEEVYSRIREQCISQSQTIEDNGQMINVVAYGFEPLKDAQATATIKFTSSSQLILIKEGSTIVDPDPSKPAWNVKTIETDRVILQRFEGSQPIEQVLTLQQPYCPKDLKPKNCIELKKIDVGREVYITFTLDPAKAFTTSEFNLNLNIEKRAFDLPLFSDSLDEEINKTQKLVDKLNGIIKNARTLHSFWTKFCFITFGVLFTTGFFNNVIGGSKENLAREKVNAVWHEKFQKDAKPGQDFDDFIFANQEEYERDLETAEEILDEAAEGEFSLPPELQGVDKDSDDAKDYHFYQQMSAKTKTESAGHLYAAKSAEVHRQAVDYYLNKTIHTPDYSRLPETDKNKFKDFVNKKEVYYNSVPVPAEVKDENEEQKLERQWKHTRNNPMILAEYKQDLEASKREGYERDLASDIKKNTIFTTDDRANAEAKARADKYFSRRQQRVQNKIYILPSEISKIGNDQTFESYKLPVANGKVKPTGKLLDADGKETTVEYILADKPELIETKYRTEHNQIVSLVEEGRNKGKVEIITVDSKTYMEVEYNEAGIMTGCEVFERTEENAALSTKDVIHIGNCQEAAAYYKEKGKENPIYKQKATWLEESKQCVSSINKNLAGKKLKPGEPVKTACKAGTYTVQQAIKPLGSSCTDVMSADNCKLLFNACDPVICPSSRCDLNNRWKEDNVVQSGLAGSTLLCAPNWVVFGGDIYTLPVCLTGIIAGLENIQSILESYKQCLITAKVDGTTLGLCDSLRNFYLCDTLWREARVLLDMEKGLLPAIAENVFGAKEGGEYTSFKANFDRSIESLNYFTKDYAKQVFASYQGASFAEIGTEVCKAAIYGKAPNIGKVLDEVTKPESPPQFTAFFNEKFYSDMKGYRENQYIVQYHIYAGSRSAVVYSVWLEAVDLTEQPLPNYPAIPVARGNTLNAGQFATETRPLTAPEGYNRICIETRSDRYGVDRQCGFGKTTTDFGVNYLIDQYTTSQAGTKGITSEEQCVPETPTITGAIRDNKPLFPAVASTGFGGLGSGLTETGIIRKCSGYNPGIGGGESQWATVGNCGKDDKGRDLGTCWLYTGNLKGLIKDQNNTAAIQTFLTDVRLGERKKELEDLNVRLMEADEAKKLLTAAEAKLGTADNILQKQFDPGIFATHSTSVKDALDAINKVLNKAYDPEQIARARYLAGYAYEQKGNLLLWNHYYGKKAAAPACSVIEFASGFSMKENELVPPSDKISKGTVIYYITVTQPDCDGKTIRVSVVEKQGKPDEYKHFSQTKEVTAKAFNLGSRITAFPVEIESDQVDPYTELKAKAEIVNAQPSVKIAALPDSDACEIIDFNSGFSISAKSLVKPVQPVSAGTVLYYYVTTPDVCNNGKVTLVVKEKMNTIDEYTHLPFTKIIMKSQFSVGNIVTIIPFTLERDISDPEKELEAAVKLQKEQ